jgi:hypothetical protein
LSHHELPVTPYFCAFQYLKGFVCVLGTLHDRLKKNIATACLYLLV